MKIQWTKLCVDDQDKALEFYADKLGFQKKTDFSNSGYRWLTVTAPNDPDGIELILEAAAGPAAKAYQNAQHDSQQPAMQFLVDDVQAHYDRLSALGVEFTTPVTAVTGSEIAVLDDTCGNLIQLTHLNWG